MDVSEISVANEVQINMDAAANEVDPNKEEADWKKPSIYRVTHFARRHNPDAFTPQVISFGPFHHGSQHLKATKVVKQRALAHFLNRARKPSEQFLSRLQSILKQLQDSYKDLDEKWKKNSNKFLEMMLLDGCFMIEVLRLNERSNDYATNDPVFSSQIEPLRKPYIKRDMLLLENQLPLLVLKALLEVENVGRTRKEIIINSLASNKDVADIFNKMSKEAAQDAPNDMFNNVRFELSKYYKKRMNKWRATLRHQYLHNPWKVLSIVAASVVIFLTFIQALYSVLSFHPGK